jgi:hypothetical protein
MSDRTLLALTRFFHFLRWPAIHAQRIFSGEYDALRSTLPHFDTVAGAIGYAMARFTYRLDSASLGPIKLHTDWITDPHVFQARLESTFDFDGDCDDYHAWIAEAARRIPGVGSTALLTVIYDGGGHTVTLIRMTDKLALVNYDSVVMVADVRQAAQITATKQGGRMRYYFAEEWPTLKLSASGLG